jgi:hypothetical protein
MAFIYQNKKKKATFPGVKIRCLILRTGGVTRNNPAAFD